MEGSDEELNSKNHIEKDRSGIYSLSFGGKIFYIGQSKDMRSRVNQHLNWRGRIRERQRKGIWNRAQQLELERYEFIRDNYNDIEVQVLEYCPYGRLNEREQKWIEFYKPKYNWEGVYIPYKIYDKREICAW